MNGRNAIATIADPEEPARPLELAASSSRHAPTSGDEEHQQLPAYAITRMRPVDHAHVRHVVARPVHRSRSCAWSSVEALHLAVERAGGDVRERVAGPVIEKLGVWSLLGEAADLEEREARTAGRCPTAPRRRRSSCGCALVTRIAEAAAERRAGAARPAPRTISASFAALRKSVDVAAAQEVPAADAEARRSTRRSGRRGSCARTRRARSRSTSSAHTLVSCASPFDDLVADRVLHPRVRDEDEVRRHPRCRARRSRASPGAARGESRFQPKIQRPRNVASRKNAARPSIASGAPKTLPTNFE